MSHSFIARQPCWRLATTACAALLLLSACNDKDTPVASTPAAAPMPAAAAVQPVSYTPPSADMLYQMVAPIALYPDKLVAQILAGSTYPDQINAAETWIAQNPGLQKAALSNAVNAQSWDPSVKSLTQFPNVLEQMASNLPWTTALGKAYYNDPADVLNAIQVMRDRAHQSGALKSSKQLRVNTAAVPSAGNYIPSEGAAMPLANGVIAPPPQYYEIAPPDDGPIYVPQYDPATAYGAPLPIYQGYSYAVPAPVVSVGAPVVAGVLGFGAGVLLMQSSHPSWGWHSWNMHWGDPDRRGWHPGNPPPPPMARPAVVYNNQTYISQSRTVVQNIHSTDNAHVTKVYENNAGPAPHQGMTTTGAGMAGAAAALGAGAAMAAHGNRRPDAMPAPIQPAMATAVAPAASHPSFMPGQRQTAPNRPGQTNMQAAMQAQHPRPDQLKNDAVPNPRQSANAPQNAMREQDAQRQQQALQAQRQQQQHQQMQQMQAQREQQQRQQQVQAQQQAQQRQAQMQQMQREQQQAQQRQAAQQAQRQQEQMAQQRAAQMQQQMQQRQAEQQARMQAQQARQAQAQQQAQQRQTQHAQAHAEARPHNGHEHR